MISMEDPLAKLSIIKLFKNKHDSCREIRMKLVTPNELLSITVDFQKIQLQISEYLHLDSVFIFNKFKSKEKTKIKFSLSYQNLNCIHLYSSINAFLIIFQDFIQTKIELY
jgi:hypothetical protein